MKTWIIAAIALGVLLVAGIFVANVNFAKAADTTNKAPSCLGCSGNSCTAEKNCGQATCSGAVNGGKCTCGK